MRPCNVATPHSTMGISGTVGLRYALGKASYRDNYERLAKIKAKYDPANLFRINQNIRPAVSGS